MKWKDQSFNVITFVVLLQHWLRRKKWTKNFWIVNSVTLSFFIKNPFHWIKSHSNPLWDHFGIGFVTLGCVAFFCERNLTIWKQLGSKVHAHKLCLKDITPTINIYEEFSGGTDKYPKKRLDKEKSNTVWRELNSSLDIFMEMFCGRTDR